MFSSTLCAKEFHLDDPVMFVIYGVILAFLIALSIFYLVFAYQKAKKLKMDMGKFKKVISTSMIFSFIPGIGIALGVVTLVGALGVAFPAIRLSIVGSLQYETQMADAAATGIAGSMQELITRGLTADDLLTISITALFSDLGSGLFILVSYKLWQPKIGKLMTKSMKALDNNDVNIGDLVFKVSFIGMVLGYIAMSLNTATEAVGYVNSYFNLIAVIIAMLLMLLFNFLIKKMKLTWLDSFATPVSMIVSMIIVGVISFCATKYGWPLLSV